MFSDKNYGIPKDLIEAAKRVHEKQLEENLDKSIKKPENKDPDFTKFSKEIKPAFERIENQRKKDLKSEEVQFTEEELAEAFAIFLEENFHLEMLTEEDLDYVFEEEFPQWLEENLFKSIYKVGRTANRMIRRSFRDGVKNAVGAAKNTAGAAKNTASAAKNYISTAKSLAKNKPVTTGAAAGAAAGVGIGAAELINRSRGTKPQAGSGAAELINRSRGTKPQAGSGANKKPTTPAAKADISLPGEDAQIAKEKQKENTNRMTGGLGDGNNIKRPPLPTRPPASTTRKQVRRSAPKGSSVYKPQSRIMKDTGAAAPDFGNNNATFDAENKPVFKSDTETRRAANLRTISKRKRPAPTRRAPTRRAPTRRAPTRSWKTTVFEPQN